MFYTNECSPSTGTFLDSLTRRRSVTRWQLQRAKHEFSRLVKRAETEGPQVVTRHGEDVAVVLGIDDYRRLRSDGGAFKRFLAEAPDLDVLEIERSREPAPTVEL
jgi:prevent-host-death family protein